MTSDQVIYGNTHHDGGYNDTYAYYKAQIPIFWLKNIIMKNKKFRIDTSDIGDYFGRVDSDPEIIYRAIRTVLSEEGIDVAISIDSNRSTFFTFSFAKTNNDDSYIKYILSNEDIGKLREFLKHNRLCDEKTQYLICPKCHTYSVEYSKMGSDSIKRWWCNHCIDVIVYHHHLADLGIRDKDKYHVYKLWGADALSAFTNTSMKKTTTFIGSYFRNCCTAKKDKCLYFDFFKENDEKDNVEGDVVDGSDKMVVVRRNARGK